jgi:capsular polysaccharide biosynthesis protein
MNSVPDLQEKDIDDLGLEDILFGLWDHKLQLLGFSVAGLLLSAGLLLWVLQPIYQAIALVEVGKNAGQLIEAPQISAERFRTPAMHRKIAENAKNDQLLVKLAESRNGLSESINAQIVKNTSAQSAGVSNPLIEIKAQAQSQEEAKALVHAMLGELIKSHQLLSAPVIKKLEFDLTIAKERLKVAEAERDEMSRLIGAASINDARFTQLSLLSNVRLSRESEIFSQRAAISSIQTSLLPPATLPTRAIEDLYVSPNPISPRRTLTLALGLLSGFVLGLLFLLGRRVAKDWKVRQSVKSA